MTDRRSRFATDLGEFEVCYHRVQVNNAENVAFVPLFSRLKSVEGKVGFISDRK